MLVKNASPPTLSTANISHNLSTREASCRSFHGHGPVEVLGTVVDSPATSGEFLAKNGVERGSLQCAGRQFSWVGR